MNRNSHGLRIVAFTDHHGSVQAAANVLRLAEREKADLIVCAGDFSEFCQRWERSWLLMAKSTFPLYFIGGNHENGPLARQGEILNPRAKWLGYWITPKVVVFETQDGRKVQFAGIDGVADLDPYSGEDEKLFNQYKHFMLSSLDPRLPLVLVTHYPPAGTKCCGSQYDDSGAIMVPVQENMYAVGSVVVRKLIEKFKPVMVITGHFHNRFGVQDRIGEIPVINPGPNGMVLEVSVPNTPEEACA